MIPAMKRVISEFSRVHDWSVVRPPLNTLPDNLASDILGQLRAAEFDMPGYPAR
jgi:hypothetical protein